LAILIYRISVQRLGVIVDSDNTNHILVIIVQNDGYRLF